MTDYKKVGRKNKKNGRLAEISALKNLARYGFRLTSSSGSGADEKGDLVNGEWEIEVKTRTMKQRKDGSFYCLISKDWITKVEKEAESMELKPCLFYRPRGYSKFIAFVRKEDFDYINVEYAECCFKASVYSVDMDVSAYRDVANGYKIAMLTNFNGKEYYVMSVSKFIELCGIVERPTLLPLYGDDKYIIDINTGRVLDMKTGRFLNVSLDEKGAFVYIGKQKRYIGTLIVTAYCNRPIKEFNIIKWDSAGTSLNDIYYETKAQSALEENAFTEKRGTPSRAFGGSFRNFLVAYDMSNRYIPKETWNKIFRGRYDEEVFTVTVQTEAREFISKNKINNRFFAVYAGEKWKPNDGKDVKYKRAKLSYRKRHIKPLEVWWSDFFNDVYDAVNYDSWVCLIIPLEGQSYHLWFSCEENIKQVLESLKGA